MMKRLKEFFDLIVALAKAWPYVSGFIILIFTVMAGLAAKIQLITIQVKMPLLLVILFISFSLYPIAKLIEWIISKNIKGSFEYDGLLWKPTWFGFGNPTPICPVLDCGCEIHYKIEQSPSVQGDYSISPFFFQKTVYSYIYECPRHNKIDVSNIDIVELKSKAKLFQNSLKKQKVQ